MNATLRHNEPLCSHDKGKNSLTCRMGNPIGSNQSPTFHGQGRSDDCKAGPD